MQRSTSIVYCLFISILLCLLNGMLSSFSAMPEVMKSALPPVEKRASTQERRRQQRLDNRYHHLHQRMEKTTNTKQRHRLQKKIRQVEQQQEGNPGLVYGLIAFILAVVGAPFVLLSAVVFLQEINPIFTAIIASCFLVATVITLAILAYVFAKKSTKKPRKGFALAALIIGGIGVLVLLGAFFS